MLKLVNICLYDCFVFVVISFLVGLFLCYGSKHASIQTRPPVVSFGYMEQIARRNSIQNNKFVELVWIEEFENEFQIFSPHLVSHLDCI